ncbi:T9SS type A sorting domain-containing protein [Taibaiella soli]|uniref:Secretion system C-terminal sorting domain-containing protein n=1 Tax=Taibaiella soli TaxID=1649169 RepID=A0A2W2B8D7_9BACT|nr:T9SS type A sorting domain-containing protein [Taibaiella soli]PZF72227.1 hypothetical protein DN068_14955 [Taibaiella soli]
MKLRPILLTAAAAFSLQANAQTWVSDSVNTTPGYANDVYYSMDNGSVSSVPNTNWHFGFQMVPQSGPSSTAGIIANHVMGKVSVYSINKQATGNFATLTANDTVGKMSNPLYNSDTAWGYGAFNQNHDPSNLFDYGWGQYNQTTHYLNGDSIYVVKVDTATYKVWMQEYVTYPNDSISWTFRIARFDNSSDTTILVPRHANGFDFTNRQFAYFNATTNTILDREPGRDTWDILFTRYDDSASQGPMFLAHYPAAGVFSNMNTTVAEVHNINPDTAGINQNYSANTNEIGYDWKHYDQTTNTWSIDSTVYFIKNGTSAYYQLQFTGFGGSATGVYNFRKRTLVPTAVKNITANNVNAVAIVPNPAQNQTAVMIDASENVGSARIIVADLNGRLLQNYAVTVNKGMNGFAINTMAIPTGMYMVTVSNGSWKVTEKLMVQH